MMFVTPVMLVMYVLPVMTVIPEMPVMHVMRSMHMMSVMSVMSEMLVTSARCHIGVHRVAEKMSGVSVRFHRRISGDCNIGLN